MLTSTKTSSKIDNNVDDDKTAQEHLNNLRVLNAHHVNQTQSLLREATAKGFGIQPDTRVQPFPGSTIVNNSSSSTWQTALAAIIAMILGAIGTYLATKPATPVITQPIQNTQPNTPITPITPVSPENDPNNYQFNVVPYDK